MAKRLFKRKKSDAVRKRNRRIRLVGVVFCLLLTMLLGRVGYIKYAKGREYETRAVKQLIQGQNIVEKETNPNRGYILDRNKQPLAVSNRVYTVVLDVTILDSLPVNTKEPAKDIKTNTLNTLSEVLEIPIADLNALFAKDAEGNLKNPTYYHILARQVPSAKAILLKDLRCVYLVNDSQRVYNDPYLAPQTIGFVRGDSSWGLENKYNAELIGEQGRIFRTYDQNNNPITEDIPARDGYLLISTLDGGIQRIAQSVVDNAAATIECQNAAMLVMDPYTGEILAMAQWPSFSLAEPGNQELFTDKRITNKWEALSEEERLNELYKVWGNFSTTYTFEPGSIFKPVVVAAALEENIIDPTTFTTFCGAKVQVADWSIPCWYKYGHGGENLVEVLANSCNVGMIDIIQRLGRDLFYKYRCDFGYGEKTDIDLPGEASVSSSSVMYTLSQLNAVELATSAMGQSFNNTAIQAITAFSAVINGGNLMKPYLVSQVVDEQGNVIKENSPTVVRKAISGATSDFLRYALEAVVTSGTGKKAAIPGYTVGGKTGSGQQGSDREQMTLSFMAFTPVENPQYIALVIINRPSDTELTSGESVSPMIKDALTQIIQYKNMRPADEDAEIASLQNSLENRSVLSDYSGMQLVDVTHNLNNLEVDYQVVGSGTVVSHHYPAAGQAAPKGAPVFLYMDAESLNEADMTVVPDVEGLLMEQGETFISDANLTPITFIDKPAAVTDDGSEGGPVTYNPGYGSDETQTDIGALDIPQYYIYKQFPSPGAQVQKGTEIKLKVKPKS